MTTAYPDRVRYMGALDDEIVRARSASAEPPSLAYINAVLAQEVLFGVPLALNDGHLFHYDAGRRALTDREASPLLELIESGYVTILSRNGDISEMPQAMLHVPSYRRLVEAPDWPLFHQLLRETQRLLQVGYNVRAWPAVDLGAGFGRLLQLSIQSGRALDVLRLNGLTRERVETLMERFTRRLEQVPGTAARSLWDEVCDSTEGISPAARRALRWLALETYHHNFAMAMSTVFPTGGIGVMTRCSDIYSFVQEPPLTAEAAGVAPEELPLLHLSRKAIRALQNGRLLADVVKPGTKLNGAKAAYLVTITQALSNRAMLSEARETAEQYSRLLAEHFAEHARSRTEAVLQVATAAFGAAAGATLGLFTAAGPGAAVGAVVGGVAAQGAIAGLFAIVDTYCPVLVQKIGAKRDYVLTRGQYGATDLELSKSVMSGHTFSSVTLASRYVHEHLKALPPWSSRGTA